MSKTPEIRSSKDQTEFSRKIREKSARKLRVRHSTQGVWFGLGMTGLIGWSVVVPTLAGVALLASGWTNTAQEAIPGH